MDKTFEYKGRSLHVAVQQSGDRWQHQYTINGSDPRVGGVVYGTEQEALDAGAAEAQAEVDEERV
ncbi:MAG: hypothetical protein EOO38_13910 [Cytophagaceae bacterium]|jgi:hypothetical protein|nr:MAG: hypothetical protein EOO38_13910 [Cytophagaceae bacterium]